MQQIIFCPKCEELILDQPTCPACGWQRPVEVEGVGETAWVADLGTRLIKPHCYPALAAGHYCLGTEDGTLLALDLASGQVTWEQSMEPGCMAHGLATDGERLFAGCEDVQPIPASGKALRAFDARTGKETWQHPTRAHSLSATATAEGTVYFTASDGRLHAVDAATGERRWAVEHPAWSPAPPAVGEGLVCAGGRGEALVAYEASDGRERWRFEAGPSGWFATQPCIAAGQVYAFCWDGCLYALEARTGQLRWRVQGERGKGFTAPPSAAEGRVFAGSRVHREVEGQQVGTYALLALSAEDGQELWRFHAERHIFAPPAVAEGTLFFGGNDGTFCAVDAASGEERWRLEVKSRAVAQPQVAGDFVHFGGRDGLIYAVRWRAKAHEEMLPPEAYETEGQYEEAAMAYALAGDLARSATLYEGKLGKRQEAAQLYERAGQPQDAAALWEELDELRRARDLYRRAGNKLGLARVLAQTGELLEAARLYEEIGYREQAAQLYEQAGDRPRAANLYVQLRQYDTAVSIWESLGAWENQVKVLLDQGERTRAARILEQHDQLERAARLYEEAEQFREALRLRLELEHWDRAVELADKAEALVDKARALERVGRPLLAAQAYERAAEQAATAKPPDEEHAAALFERAYRLYDDLFEEERVAACRRQMQRYYRLPEIVVQGHAESAFIEYEWNTLHLEVENSGYGPARRIAIEFGNLFQAKEEVCLRGLRSQKAQSLRAYVRSKKGQYGPTVPLDIRVTYEDLRGERHQLTDCIPVRVVQQGIIPGITTPVQIQIGEMYQPGARKEVGDRLRMDIQRTEGRHVTLEEGASDSRISVRRNAELVRRCPTCNVPIQAEDHRFCPDCGARLVEDC